jgi:GNAT superfamily N-acetyltransferase
MIRRSDGDDFEAIYTIINDAAMAYRDVIPPDRWHDPYMPRAELEAQIADGVEFSCYVEGAEVVGVMGIQDRGDVRLIRHAYVRSARRNAGIGAKLLRKLIDDGPKPILIGTWKAASWAIAFYEKHGFRLLDDAEKTRLLKKYWTIPVRQVETSVVLADENYRTSVAPRA